MKLSGRIHDIQIEYRSRKAILSLVVDQVLSGIEDLMDKDLEITIKKQTRPRSLNSNAYFHVLCDKLRQKNKVSLAAQKNELITMFGQMETMDGAPLIYKTNAPPEYMAEREEVHMKYIKTDQDGVHFYRAYRGSHTYSVDEMQLLLDGTIELCKEAGIETETPETIAKMQALWRKDNG